MLGMLARLIEVATWAYNLGLLIYVVADYVRARWAGQVRRGLSPFYEPALRALRPWVPPIRMGRARLDLSPIALLILVVVLRSVVIYVLTGG